MASNMLITLTSMLFKSKPALHLFELFLYIQANVVNPNGHVVNPNAAVRVHHVPIGAEDEGQEAEGPHHDGEQDIVG